MKIKAEFRVAMNWLHTWAGIGLGTLLFIVFWMGTLSVFDREIDEWMEPVTRIEPLGSMLGVDEVVEKIKAARPGGDLSSFYINLPRDRHRFFEFYAEFEGQDSVGDRLHPATGESLGPGNTRAATGFFYPMHYRLLIRGNLGYWIVAFGTIFMMVLLVTGVVIHRKIFRDFFTFRPKKSIGRSSLDLHNVTGIVFLPFHFLICLSGFAIFAGFYASLPFAVLKDFSSSSRAVELIYAADEYAYYRRPATGTEAVMLSISPMVEQAEAIWSDRHGQIAVADRVDGYHYGDGNSFIEIRRHFSSNRVEARRDSINFDGSTGEILKDFEASPARQVRAWMEGFHQARFDHWFLLWLFFIAGLSGCLLIATGFIFWLTSRRTKAMIHEPLHMKLIEAMSAGSTTGIIVATFSYLVVNRLLHGQSEIFGMIRESFEIRTFFVVWILTFLHGIARRRRAWSDQAWMIGSLCLAAVFLNWVTTGDHLIATASTELWAVFGVDLTLLACVFVCGYAVVHLRNYGEVPTGSKELASKDATAARLDVEKTGQKESTLFL